ncbi:hypothetical protein B0H10DRAFT_1987888 [Mycena sp. CBHHK59/15]|nr:hypothetical protein B0H10DRAFT_1987888 [Mycena sp. CBHHK59/15]
MANRTSTPSICQLTPPTPATALCTHRQNQHHNSLRADQHPLDIPTSQTTSNPSNERAGMTTHNHDSMIPIQPTNQPDHPSHPVSPPTDQALPATHLCIQIRCATPGESTPAEHAPSGRLYQLGLDPTMTGQCESDPMRIHVDTRDLQPGPQGHQRMNRQPDKQRTAQTVKTGYDARLCRVNSHGLGRTG